MESLLLWSGQNLFTPSSFQESDRRTQVWVSDRKSAGDRKRGPSFRGSDDGTSDGSLSGLLSYFSKLINNNNY